MKAKRPCQGCPFATKTEGYLRPDRAEEIADVARYGEKDFYCHKTTAVVEVWDEEAEEDVEDTVATSESELCFGYVVAAARDGSPGPMMRVEAALRMIDPQWVENCDPEHEMVLDPDEMQEMHEAHWRRARRRAEA